jgi:hypothetical protein
VKNASIDFLIRATALLPMKSRIVTGAGVPRVSRVRLARVAVICAIPAVLSAAGSLDHAASPSLWRALWRAPAAPMPSPLELLAQATVSDPAPAVARPAVPTAEKLQFEVATVKPAAPLNGRGTPRLGPGTSDPERVNYRYLTRISS